jgi:hypothetical protein
MVIELIGALSHIAERKSTGIARDGEFISGRATRSSRYPAMNCSIAHATGL